MGYEDHPLMADEKRLDRIFGEWETPMLPRGLSPGEEPAGRHTVHYTAEWLREELDGKHAFPESSNTPLNYDEEGNVHV